MQGRHTKREQFARYHDFIRGTQTASPQRIRPQVKTNQRETGSKGVKSDCLKYLKSLSLYYYSRAENMATGAGYTENGLFVHFGRKGRSDIYFTLDGRIFYIECKSGSGGYLSSEQVLFRGEAQDAGAVYLVVCSVNELKAALAPYLDKAKKKPGVADFENDPELQGELI